jgi:hypothetical protein
MRLREIGLIELKGILIIKWTCLTFLATLVNWLRVMMETGLNTTSIAPRICQQVDKLTAFEWSSGEGETFEIAPASFLSRAITSVALGYIL